MEGRRGMRVQRIADECKAEVPSQYLQQPQNRPRLSVNTDEDIQNIIPVIDLFGFDADHKDSVREGIAEACREWGVFHVVNHGVPLELMDQIRTAGSSFFRDCPFHEKLKYACDSTSPASQGYGSKLLLPDDQSNGQVLDWRDYFDHHTLPLSRRHPSRWPHFPPHYREVVGKYSDQMNLLAQRLLGLISESLGLSTSYIKDAIGDFYQNITISYYPPCPQPQLTLGLQSHSDMGALTLLIQDEVPGLQVFRDSHWFTVQPLSHALLVILSDQTEHVFKKWNTRNMEKKRYSLKRCRNGHQFASKNLRSQVENGEKQGENAARNLQP